MVRSGGSLKSGSHRYLLSSWHVPNHCASPWLRGAYTRERGTWRKKAPGSRKGLEMGRMGPARDGLWGGRSREQRLVVRTRAWKVLDLRGRRERLRKVLDTQTCLVGAHLEEAKGHEAAEEAGLHR